MKIKLSDALRIRLGLEYLLNGRERVVRHNNEDSVVREPFMLGADTLLSIAVNSGKLHPLQEAYSRAHTGLVKQISGGAGTVQPGTKEAVELQEKANELLDAEHDVDLTVIEIARLKIDDNHGIASALAHILPIVKV